MSEEDFGFWIPPLLMRLSMLMYVQYVTFHIFSFTVLLDFLNKAFYGGPEVQNTATFHKITRTLQKTQQHFRKHNKITENTILQET